MKMAINQTILKLYCLVFIISKQYIKVDIIYDDHDYNDDDVDDNDNENANDKMAITQIIFETEPSVFIW